MTYIKSTKRQDLLVHMEFIFEKDYTNETNEKTYWKVNNGNVLNIILTSVQDRHIQNIGTKGVLHKDTHNHTPDVTEISAKVTINKLKDIACSSQITSTPYQIVANSISAIIIPSNIWHFTFSSRNEENCPKIKAL